MHTLCNFYKSAWARIGHWTSDMCTKHCKPQYLYLYSTSISLSCIVGSWWTFLFLQTRWAGGSAHDWDFSYLFCSPDRIKVWTKVLSWCQKLGLLFVQINLTRILNSKYLNLGSPGKLSITSVFMENKILLYRYFWLNFYHESLPFLHPQSQFIIRLI